MYIVQTDGVAPEREISSTADLERECAAEEKKHFPLIHVCVCDIIMISLRMCVFAVK